MVLSLTTPPYIGVLGKLASWKHRCAHAHWIMDLYPDVLFAHGMARSGGFLCRTLKALTRFQLRGAHAVVALGPVMAEKVADGGLGSIAEIAARRVFSPAYLAAHPEKVEERKKVLLDIDPKAFQAACKILQETDLVPLLHHLKVPTLVVCGEFDQATPPPLNKQIVEKVPGAQYIELPGCGHCPPLEQPQQFLAAIKEFVGL